MNGKGGLVSRLVVVALLAVGLVGMHHLVVVACHHATGQATAVLAAESPHSTHGLPHDQTAPLPQQAPEEAPTDLLGAAATCLAILLMIVLLIAPRLLSRLRRVLVPDLMWAPSRLVARLLAPPDLHLLSVSRT